MHPGQGLNVKSNGVYIKTATLTLTLTSMEERQNLTLLTVVISIVILSNSCFSRSSSYKLEDPNGELEEAKQQIAMLEVSLFHCC